MRSLERLYEQVVLTVMVCNGDGHLKKFGVLYNDEFDIRLSPLFDVVTTSIYKYTRYGGGPEVEDRTLALKLFKGKNESRTYPIDRTDTAVLHCNFWASCLGKLETKGRGAPMPRLILISCA